MDRNPVKADTITHKQLGALCFVSVLSPMIRLLPRMPVDIGGYVTWLSPVIAAPGVFLILMMANRIVKNQPAGCGMADAVTAALGRYAGGFILIILCIWFSVYLGIVLRSSAERLISSIYPNGTAMLFAVTILIVSLLLAKGKLKSLSRMSEIYLAIAGSVLVLVLIAAFSSVNVKRLLPVTVYDSGDIFKGAIPIINVMSVTAYFTVFSGHVSKTEKKGYLRTALSIGIILLIMITTIGSLSAGLIKDIQHPVFVMIRDLEVFGVIERIEALVIVLWVVADVTYFASLLKINGELCKTALKKGKKEIYIIISGGIAFAAGMILTGNAFRLDKLSEVIAPLVNMGIICFILPITLFVGILRKKI